MNNDDKKILHPAAVLKTKCEIGGITTMAEINMKFFGKENTPLWAADWKDDNFITNFAFDQQILLLDVRPESRFVLVDALVVGSERKMTFRL